MGDLADLWVVTSFTANGNKHCIKNYKKWCHNFPVYFLKKLSQKNIKLCAVMCAINE